MLSDTMIEIRRNALRALVPPPRLSLSTWIERDVKLPADVSSLPGSIRLYPFQRGMADAMSDPKIERVTIVKSARIGYTTLLVGLLGSHVVNEPAPVLFVLPTEDDCRNFVVNNVEPTFEASPALAGVLAADNGKDSRNTLLARRFPGGSLKVVAAKAPRNLRAHNARILIVDEADAMELTRDGSPIAAAEYRTTSFPDRKIVVGSTPLHEETSHVLASYNHSDKRIFEVPCPECGDFHEIRWKDIKWPDGEPEKAFWCCPSCGSVVEERRKLGMVERGRWRALAPEVKGHAGFRINALVSPLANAAWGKLAAEFIKSKNDPSLLQTFVNLTLGEAWSDRGGEQIDETGLIHRREPWDGRLPEGVCALTAGIDTQGDRLECQVIAWGAQEEAWIVAYQVFHGDPSGPKIWQDLDDFLLKRFEHQTVADGLEIMAACLDTGGHHARAAYDFVRTRYSRKIWGIKGSSTPGAQAWPKKPTYQNKGSIPLYTIGSDALKDTLAARLNIREAGPGYIHFPRFLEEEYFRQLTAEQRVTKLSKGRPVRVWEKRRGQKRNEALDTFAYALAALTGLQTLGLDLDAEAARLRDLAIRPAKQPARQHRSNWMSY